MKAMNDPTHALTEGLDALRQQFALPAEFPPEVSAAAEAAAAKPIADHVDRTSMPFVTLDPASSTDLDQAFTIESSGGALLLHYAIADVAWFVADGDPVDVEAWTRGETIYLPDGKVGLYPKVLSEGAASLLPDGPRPAILFTTRVAGDGSVKLDGVERAMIHSRAKLGYETATAEQLPAGFDELARRIQAAEDARGASRVEPPEQEVASVPGGGYELRFRTRFPAEDGNASLSLASNLAVAALLQDHHTGLVRTMPAPSKKSHHRLRMTAKAFGIEWAPSLPLEQFQKALDPCKPVDAAMMMAIRRAGRGAAYVPYTEGVVPWHSAMAATYAHATAPLRRLADRYVIEAALAVANGRPVPDAVTAAFAKLPTVMAKADGLAAQVDRGAIDLAEAVMLSGMVGTSHRAIVTDIDERGARIQLSDLAVATRFADATGLVPGDEVTAKLTEVDPVRRLARFERAP